MTIWKYLASIRHAKKFQKGTGLRFISEGSKWVKQKDGCAPGVLTSTKDLPTSHGVTMPELLFQNWGKWKDNTLIICGETGRQYKYSEVYKKSKNFAESLIQAGFKRRDTICILLPNIPEYPIISLGVMQAGITISPINPNYTRDEIVHQIRDCGAKCIITIPSLLPLVNTIRPLCPSLTTNPIVVSPQPQANSHSFFEMIKTDCSGAKLLKGTEIDTTDFTCLLAYSSGTTGPPKGVQHTHSSLIYSLQQNVDPEFCQTEMFRGEQSHDRYLSTLPFFHMFGLHCVLDTAMYHGVTCYSLPKFDPKMFLKGLLEYKPTTLHLVTPLLNWLVQDASVPKSALSHCRGVFISAAPIGNELKTKFLNKFGSNIFIQEVYAMTEVLATHMVPKAVHNVSQGSCGVLTPGTTCKVVDVDSGEILGANQPGEICCQTGSVMKGYLGNDNATNSTIKDGYLHSGDIGYYDEQGFYYVVDRLKDLIKVKGFQVAPSELENVLRHHPEIGDVAVIGVKHERFGEAPRAYVVKKNVTLSEYDVNKFLEPQLASHKYLAGGIEFVESIPKTLSGKILRRNLSENYKKYNKC